MGSTCYQGHCAEECYSMAGRQAGRRHSLNAAFTQLLSDMHTYIEGPASKGSLGDELQVAGVGFGTQLTYEGSDGPDDLHTSAIPAHKMLEESLPMFIIACDI